MQRPRRTTEIYEEIGDTGGKRQVRQNGGPSPTPGTAQKYASRKSRMTRPTSLDRGNLCSTLAPPTNSSVRGSRVTPQNTPLRTLSATRVLFSVEKQRSTMGAGGGGGALNTDKKWQHEQMQRISEHLRWAAGTGAIAGIGADFFARPACLRQLSVKQFVAVVNYFLQVIAGTRLTVGVNYVDDIVKHLQKLNYPHQVNKSWLKTPNTQHAFGNIILLLEFFMDFVIPPIEGDGDGDELQFPLQEPQELSSAAGHSDEHFVIPDTEFQAQLLQDSERGFMLWDKQLMQEFSQLQQRTCDEFIRKRCNVQGAAALDSELCQLRRQLDELKRRRPPTCHDEVKRCQQGEEEFNLLQQQLDMLQNEVAANDAELRILREKKCMAAKEVACLEEEIAQLRSTISKQKCSAAERDQRIENLAHLKHMLQSKERTVRKLQDRSHYQQVLLSRTKKQLTDQVEKFNAQIREIAYALPNVNADELQLPLNPQVSQLKGPIKLLKELRIGMEKQLAQLTHDQAMMDDRIAQLELEIESHLEPLHKAFAEEISVAQKDLQDLLHTAESDRAEHDSQVKAIKDEIKNIEQQSSRICDDAHDIQSKLLKLKEENGNYMADVERRHKLYIKRRNEAYTENVIALKKLQMAMDKLEESLYKNEAIVKHIDSMQRPPTTKEKNCGTENVMEK